MIRSVASVMSICAMSCFKIPVNLRKGSGRDHVMHPSKFLSICVQEEEGITLCHASKFL